MTARIAPLRRIECSFEVFFLFYHRLFLFFLAAANKITLIKAKKSLEFCPIYIDENLAGKRGRFHCLQTIYAINSGNNKNEWE